MNGKNKKWIGVMVVACMCNAWNLRAGDVVENSVESIQEKVEGTFIDKTKQATESFLRGAGPLGNALADLFGLSKDQEQLDELRKLNKTENNTYAEIKKHADFLLKAKNAVEATNNRVNQAISLGKKFQGTSLKKMFLGQLENASGFSLNPARYIPNTKYTKKLKRNMQYSCSKEKQTIGATNRFLRNTGKLVGIKASRGEYKSLGELNKALEKAIQYDHTVNEYTSSSGLVLADNLERSADVALFKDKNGKKVSRIDEMEAMLNDKDSNLTIGEKLQIELAIQSNALKAAELQDRARQLRQEASKMTKEEKQAIAAQQDRLALRDMLKYELKERRRKKELRKVR
jgi:hypothetical protein